MRNKSKQLTQFLADRSILHSDDEALIRACIKEYRKLYNREWHKAHAQKNKFLKPGFTNAEYEAIAVRARLFGLLPTQFARQVLLENCQQTKGLIPERQILMQILQYISMCNRAGIYTRDGIQVAALLYQAEQLLLEYLNIKA